LTGIEFVVGYLVAWVVRKARRVGERADAEVDLALDAGMDRLHGVVARKLGDDRALAQLESEAAQAVNNPRTRQRVQLAIEEAAEADPGFAAQVTKLVTELRKTEAAAGAIAAGDHAVAVGRDVKIHAERGSAAGWTLGPVTFGGGPADPHRPGQPQG
jgi:hypothetical protein